MHLFNRTCSSIATKRLVHLRYNNIRCNLTTKSINIEEIEINEQDIDQQNRLKTLVENNIPTYPNFIKNYALQSNQNRIKVIDEYRQIDLKHNQEEAQQPKWIPFNDLSLLKDVYETKIEKGGRHKHVKMEIAGRVVNKREASSKLFFYDVQVNHQRIQVVLSKSNWNSDKEVKEDFNHVNKLFRRGDLLRFEGFIGKTNTGTLSLFAYKLPELLSPCLQDLPLPNKLGSTDKRFRRRYLDFILSEEASKAIKYRSKTISYIRKYLDDRGFIEVETPILANKAGGASARPFTTIAHALDNLPLHLRIAPELYLKQMVIGGFDKVYEVGKVFRNESIDTNHNPEFTTCEFYLAYANLDTLFNITEDMLKGIVKEVTGSYELKILDPVDEGSLSINDKQDNQNINQDNPNFKLIDFSKPFNKVNVIEELERCLKTKLPDFDGPVEPFIELCKKNQIKLSGPLTTTRVLDKMISHFIEPKCLHPTFLFGHPIVMSPLAKTSHINNQIASRFELFINYQEFVNAYEELNDPNEQKQRFLSQLKDREVFGDNEAQVMDLDFCNALSFGLPPTAGWGLGIDRLVALLAKAPNIRSTLSFPLMKPL